jgi:tRNA threonylcarbamoyladenosine biosynthesis protein TsaE
MIRKLYSHSPEETKAWGSRLAQLLFPGAVVGLEGELGVGKTCFVKGLAAGLGLDEKEITSPTFTLIAEHYRGRIPLYHIDLYRLEGGGIGELGLEEYLDGQGVSVIEWFRFLPAGMVGEYLLISLSFLGAEERELTFCAQGLPYKRVVAAL